MHQHHAAKLRPVAVVLVVLAHVPLVLLFLWGWHASRHEPEQALVFVGLWPPMQAQQQAVPTAPPTAPRRTSRPRREPDVAPSITPEAPPSAITTPAESPAPVESALPSVDWSAEGRAAAARQVTGQPGPAASTEFSIPPRPVHKACEKQKSSWEWNRQPKKAGIASVPYGVPLPYVVVGRCVIGLGFFGCSPQKPPEANSHLLDDMRDGKRTASSVPDHERCD